MYKKLLALLATLAFIGVFLFSGQPASAAPKHLAAPSTQASITKFMTCYAAGSPNIYRAQMWNYWTQYAQGEQRPSTNTVQFQKYINGVWTNNDWVTSANADLKWGSSVQQRVGPLNPPGRWNFNFTAPSGDRVQLRASGSGRALDCTSLAP